MPITNGIRRVSVFVDDASDADNRTVVQQNLIVSGDDMAWPIRQAKAGTERQPANGEYFNGYRSEAIWRFIDPDGTASDQLISWFERGRKVQMVAEGISGANVQWYHDTRCRVRRLPIASRHSGRGDIFEAEMIKDGGEGDDHDIHGNANIFAHLGWEDSDSDGTADGYTAFSGTTTAFASDVQDVSGSSGTIGIFADVIFPIEGATVTLSIEHTALHGSGADRLVVRARDSTGSTLTNVSESISATGRNSAELTLDANTWDIHNRVMLVESVTASGTQSAKFPALRTDGETTYVAY